MSENEITEQVIGLAIKIHRGLGPGLLESAYEACLYYEVLEAGLYAERQKTGRSIMIHGVDLVCHCFATGIVHDDALARGL